MGHSGTLSKVRNVEAMFERVASSFLLKVHPLESMRTAPLAAVIHDDLNNYALASDFGSLIDLTPEGDRTSWDRAFRDRAGRFDREKAIRNQTISIEGSEGSKIIRINWKARQAKILNTMNSYNGNGTWSAVGTATSVATDTVTKFSGGGAVRFNVLASGDGIQNTTMTQIDLTTENGIADVIIPVYLGTDYANLTSVTGIWGNDLTAKYWTGVAQTTQADGTPFKFGWNLIKIPWSSATQTGTNTTTAFDSFKITFTTNGTGTLASVRVDNILFSIGRAFDHKYYSKFLYKNAATGAWVSRPRDDNSDDLVMIDNDTLAPYLHECLIAMAQQMEGTDGAFDISFAENQLKVLFPAYRGLYPSQVMKARGQIGGTPGRGRW